MSSQENSDFMKEVFINQRNQVPWYKDRDFPEIKSGNDDVVAVVENPAQRARLLDAHNNLLTQIAEYKRLNSEMQAEVTELKTKNAKLQHDLRIETELRKDADALASKWIDLQEMLLVNSLTVQTEAETHQKVMGEIFTALSTSTHRPYLQRYIRKLECRLLGYLTYGQQDLYKILDFNKGTQFMLKKVGVK